MKSLMLAAVLAIAPAAMAHELDNVSNVSAKQLEAAQHLPRTVVVRTPVNDPTKAEVVEVKEGLKPEQKADGLNFKAVALNAEKNEINYTSKNELDVTSSVSSWRFGFYPVARPYYAGGYYGGYAGYGGYGGGYYPGYNYGYARAYYPSYSYAAVAAPCGYNSCNYYPSYAYAGYNYGYAPYYSYCNNGYNYSYYGWTY
jgi:hypothetical protein